jgi:predicted RNase H-like HicB family nuclease
LRKFIQIMELNFKYWKDGIFWVGYLELYPDYWTQGESEEELQINLRELYDDLNSGELPGPVKQGVLKIA